MANITKRVNKRAAEHLGGETAEVVLLCEMKGGLGVGAVATVIARRTTEKAMRNRTAETLEEAGGMAAEFPAATCVVAVTISRVIAMESNGITFKAPSLTLPRAAVRAELMGRRGLGRRLLIHFADETGVEVDVGSGQPLNEFVAALTGPTVIR
ncbi:MAG: hypothetical protein AAF567_02175 [Actinomycetota bacterium]